jgi:hypothetical protein
MALELLTSYDCGFKNPLSYRVDAHFDDEVVGEAKFKVLKGKYLAEFFIDVSDLSIRGKEVFDALYSTLGQERKVDGMYAHWSSDYPADLQTFNNLQNKGFSLEDAARNTFTGKMMARHGSFKPCVVNLQGDVGTYRSAEVVFLPE